MTLSQMGNFEFELFKKFSAHDAYPLAEEWLDRLLKLPSVNNGDISGELRRCKSAVDHIDIALSTDDLRQAQSEIMAMNGYEKVLDHSDTQISLLLPLGLKITIWLAHTAAYASTLLFSTGSVNHLTNLSRRGLLYRFTFEQDSIRRYGHLVEIKTEREIYSSLDLPWIPPELRESGDEIEHAKEMDFTNLIQINDIKSDLHVHSTWSDGKNSIEEMAAAAIDRGLSFISICDHSPYMLDKYKDASYLLEQALEIKQIQKNIKSRFKLLKGVEVDILPDGSLDLSEEILKKMDVVVASMHIKLDQPMEVATARLIRAIENPYVNIIGHPGGRTYPMVDIIDLDWDRIYRAAAYNKVALEINSHKSHPIFNDQKARAAAQTGALISINSDSHSTAMMSNFRFGIATARRAGLKTDQVINTWTIKHLQLWLRQKKDAIAKVQ